MSIAAAARGGISAGQLNEELAGAVIPPPLPPKLNEGERCFRSRKLAQQIIVKDTSASNVGGVPIRGERHFLRFMPHPVGQFGEYVVDTKLHPEELLMLLDAAGLQCRHHRRPFDQCKSTRCTPLLPAGDVWEASSQVEEFASRRSAQLLAELKGNPELAARVTSGLAEGGESFALDAKQPSRTRRPKEKDEAKPEAPQAPADQPVDAGGLNT